MAIFFYYVLVLYALLPLVYLQILNSTITCATERLAAKTVFDFWQDNTQDCEIDAHNLYKIYKKFSIHSAGKRSNDQISYLLHGHVSSTLMQTLFNQLINTISTKAFSAQPELETVINRLYEVQDKSFILNIWQKVLDETYAFMGKEDLLQQILLLANSDLKLSLLEYLLMKYENQHKINNKFLPLLTFGVTSVLKERQQSHAPLADHTIGRLLGKLPEQLLIIFQSWNYNVSILNGHYNEFIFPERHNGSTAANKRFLFNFLPTKNNFHVKGKFKLDFNPRGLLTLGAPYGDGYKYLIGDETNAFICLDCVIDAAQWWQVLWPYNEVKSEDQQFVLFQNTKSKKLLCSTSIINEYFVLISVLDFAQHMHDSQCHWKVVKRVK